MTTPDLSLVEGDLDPLLHAPVRLRLLVTLSTLAVGDSLTFPRLQELLNTTSGNLVTHLRKLEQGGNVETQKTNHRKRQSTSVRLTSTGRAALDLYTQALRALLDPTGPLGQAQDERIDR